MVKKCLILFVDQYKAVNSSHWGSGWAYGIVVKLGPNINQYIF